MLIEQFAENEKHAPGLQDLGQEYVDRVSQILNKYGNDLSDSEKANFKDTLVRASKAYADLFRENQMVSGDFKNSLGLEDAIAILKHGILPKPEIMKNLKEILQTGFPMEDDCEDGGIVTQGPIRARSLCPHHLLPVLYEVYVAYKPVKHGYVLGLSKLARIVQELAKRPVLQEQYTADVADVLHFAEGEDHPLPQIKSDGSAVQVIGAHSCMACRGVRSDALTLTTILRGTFSNSGLRDEFYQAVQALQASGLHKVKEFSKNPFTAYANW